MHKKLPWWIAGLLTLSAGAAFFWLERRRPLRRSVESKLTRNARNLAVAGIGAAVVQFLEQPVTQPLSAWVDLGRWGLLKALRLPAWIELPAAVLLMDYTLYLWHVLTHSVPVLWRCHLAHHVDLDLDASTGLRFHFAELAASIPYRAAQIALIGVSPLPLSIWQTFLTLCILFHHSNFDLSIGVERKLTKWLVTPRMHGIHHSVVRQETFSNFSSGFALWDRLHGTLRLNVPQSEITIGVPAYRQAAQVTLPKLLAMPFVEQRRDWILDA